MIATILAVFGDPAVRESGVGVFARVFGFFAAFFVVGAVVGVAAVVVARKKQWLKENAWARRSVFVLWVAGVPALLCVEGFFFGAGRAAEFVVEHNHLTERIAGVAVHGAVDVVFKDARAAALLDEGRFPIAKTQELFELLPQTLSHDAVAAVEAAVVERAGSGAFSGFAAFVAVRVVKLGAGAVVLSSSAARAAWATPVLHALQKTDDGDGLASVAELASAVVRVHAEPRVGRFVDDVIASQGLPFLVGAVLLLLLPVVVERAAAWRRRRATVPPAQA